MNDGEPENIQLFNQFTALILGRLYARHPIPTDIMIGHLTDQKPDISQPTTARMRAHWPLEAQVAIHTIEWLEEQGYIRAGRKFPFGMADARLTDRAWEILRRPSSLEKSKTWGELLKKHGSQLLSKVVDRSLAELADLFRDNLG